MSDVFDVPVDDPLWRQVFLGTDFTVPPIPQIWYKPVGARFVSMLLIGSGSGGGGGFQRAAGSAGGGGAGGGSGSVTRAIFLADTLPDSLNVLVAGPSLGGPASTIGSSAQHTMVSYDNTSTPNMLFLVSGGGTVAAGGPPGTAAGGGTAGTSSGAAAVNNATFSCIALAWHSLFGATGANGGVQVGAVGANITSTTQWSMAGAGGAGCTTTDFAGGTVGANWLLPAQPVPTVPGGDGASGAWSWKPPVGQGGGGGSSNNSGQAGRGGNGAIGCGGGGGGAGLTGGAGGNGGPGLAIITCW